MWKKITFSIALALVVVTGGLWAIGFHIPETGKTEARGTLSVAATVQDEKDSDNDGLKDWEETLWKSDPSNADTDGDGTSDGAEVVAGRNPTIKGPRDLVAVTVSATTSVKTSSAEPNTLTDSFAKEFFSNYLSLRNAGIPQSAKDGAYTSVISTVSAEAKQQLEQKIPFEKILIDPISTAINERAYANAVASVILAHREIGSANAIALLERYIMKGDDGAHLQLVQLATHQSTFANELLSIRTPKDLGPIHLSLVNSARTLGLSLSAMAASNQDPTVTLFAVKSYQDSYAGFLSSLQDLANFLRGQGIVFSEKESGIMFSAL